MKSKKGKIIIGLIVLVIACGGIYLYIDSQEESTSSSSDKNKKYYKEVEKTLLESAKDYLKYNSHDENILTAKEIIEGGYLKEKDLEVSKTKDTCEGYVDLSTDEYKAYIKCKKYTTKGYQKSVSNLESITKSISYTLVNEEDLKEEFTIKVIKLAKDEVVVRGNKDMLDKVDNVKAIVDLNKIDIKDPGLYEMEDIKLVAYDEDGKEVNDIELAMNTISASITIVSESKMVPVKVKATGNLIVGKALNKIYVDEDSIHYVTIYGAQEAINKVDYIVANVDISGLGEEDKELKVDLIKPDGVKTMSQTSVNVQISFAGSKEIAINVPITVRDLNDDLEVTKIEIETVDVNIIGSENNVDGLTEDNVSAFIDLKGYKKGTYEVEIHTECVGPLSTDSLYECMPETQKVKIKIEKK